MDRSSALTLVLVLLVIIAATDATSVFYMSRITSTVWADLDFASPYHALPKLYASGTVNPSRIDPILNLPRRVI